MSVDEGLWTYTRICVNANLFSMDVSFINDNENRRQNNPKCIANRTKVSFPYDWMKSYFSPTNTQIILSVLFMIYFI